MVGATSNASRTSGGLKGKGDAIEFGRNGSMGSSACSLPSQAFDQIDRVGSSEGAASGLSAKDIMESEGEGRTVSDRHESHGQHHKGGHSPSSHAAVMIWLGILIDAVPESIVLGILASTATQGSLMTFVIGVFLSNLPEAMSSSGTMRTCGFPAQRILLMWSSIVGLTGVGAGLGAVLFPPGSEDTSEAQFAIAGIEGMCGGAMLAMIANTALPEAFEQGGDVVGGSCLAGFLCALLVSVISS